MFMFGIVDKHALQLGPAERADVIIDFSGYANKTLLLYNDAPAAFPNYDPRWDYYTGDSDQTDIGGAPMTQPGYGPNTRTIMQIKVKPTPVASPYNLTNLTRVFAKGPGTKRGVFEVSQPNIIVTQAAYNSAYNKTLTADISKEYVQLYQHTHTFQNITGASLNIKLEPKAINDEMGAAYEQDYGRMSSMLGLQVPNATTLTQNFMLLGYASPPVEVIKDSMIPLAAPAAGDGTQLWKIVHNGVDSHTYHFHLYNVQLVNRIGWDGVMVPPDADELGWKETVRVDPLEQTIVALRPVAPKLPFKVPNSTRLIDPTMPAGAILIGPPQGGFFDPAGNGVTVTNHLVNFGWEYVIHCHLLGHEEMDMMHAQAFAVAPEAPSRLNATVANIGHPVTLTWVDNSISETGFTIQRATNAGFTTGLTTFAVGPNIGTYIDTTAVASTTYYYRVQANNVVGDTTVYPAPSIGYPQISTPSKWSNTLTVNTTPTMPAIIALRASNGQYVVAENGGGGVVGANRNAIGPWETFGLINRGNGNVALRASNGQYVVAENGGGGVVGANRNAIGPWETFGLIDRGNGNIALRASNGQYVVAENGGGGAVNANRNAIGPWETFRMISR
jgi:FtsP/CotA-like multicopper oxidase with cupredoxin domain